MSGQDTRRRHWLRLGVASLTVSVVCFGVLVTSSHFERLVAANDMQGAAMAPIGAATERASALDTVAMLPAPEMPADKPAMPNDPETERARMALATAQIDLRAPMAAAPIVQAALAIEPPRAAPVPRGPAVFGSIPIVAPALPISRIFQRAFAERSSDGIAGCAEGRDTCLEKLPASWRRVVLAARDLPRDEQLAAINRAVNQRIAYREDLEAHGELDVWSTPHEIMAAGAGDCEDYAVLKMHLLSLAGVAPEDMHVVVVKADHLAAKHAVLTVRHGEETLVLDNLAAVVRPDRAAGYVAMFSINAGGFWIHGAPANQPTKVAERQARVTR